MNSSLLVDSNPTDAANTENRSIVDNSSIENDDSIAMNVIFVNGHKYKKESMLQMTSEYTTYSIRDDIRRQFTLKIANVTKPKDFVLSLNKLKGKSCIASIIEYQILHDQVLVVFEAGKPINIREIPKNLLKRRMKQIITAAASVADEKMDFTNLSLDDFINTNGGFRLIHFESTYKSPLNSSIKTFAPVIPLLKEIFDGKRAELDNDDVNNFQKAIKLTETTEISKMKELLDSEVLRDGFRVVINKGNRSATPDPHNLIPFKRRRRRQVQEEDEYDNEPVIIKRIEPGDIPSVPYLLFLSIGVLISFSVNLYIKLTLRSSLNFTSLLINVVLVICSVCCAFIGVVFTKLKDEFPPTQLTSKLKKWCIFLNATVIMTIGCKSLEISYDPITSSAGFILMVWLCSSMIIS